MSNRCSGFIKVGRLSLAAVGGFAAIACSSQAGSNNGADPDAAAGAPDAAPHGDLPPPDHGFQVVTPEILIAPGEEVTYCYYTTMPATADVGVKKWESKMSPGSHHMILYFLDAPGGADGTLDTACAGGSGVPVWTYAAQSEDHHQDMPTGIGMTVHGHQAAMLQMHYLNTTEAPLHAHVTLNAHTYADGETYTKAAAYVTFNTQINVAPHSDGSVTGTCAVPAGVSFFTMSTHAHRHSTLATVKDADTLLVESKDWEHPTIADWGAPTFEKFGAQLTYHCEYHNDTDVVVKTGQSAKTDEMCMAVGYFFPATAPVFCLDSNIVSQ